MSKKNPLDASIQAVLFYLNHPHRSDGIKLTYRDRVQKQASDTLINSLSYDLKSRLYQIFDLIETHETHLDKQTLRSLQLLQDDTVQLLDDAIDLISLNQDNEIFSEHSLNLPELIEGSFAEVSQELVGKNVEIHLGIDQTLPQYIFCDESRLRQVMIYLLKELIQELSISSLSVLAVGDLGGVGFWHLKLEGLCSLHAGETIQSWLHGPSAKSDSLHKSLLFHILDGLKARLDLVQSDESRFLLQVSFPSRDGNPVSKARSIRKVDTSDILAAKLSVLVADDDELARDRLTRLLETLGCQVQAASDGGEVLKLLDRQTFDVCLMDCYMPEVDGFEATRRIRQQRQNAEIFIVAVTGSDSARAQCKKAGMDDYVIKPIYRDTLCTALRRAINRKELSSEDDVKPLPQEKLTEAPLTRDDSLKPRLEDDDILALVNDLFEGDVGFFKDSINKFKSNSQENFRSMQQALKAENFGRLAALLHYQKGMYLNLGLHSLSHACMELGVQIVDGKGVNAQDLSILHIKTIEALGDFDAFLLEALKVA
ncbi:MAG: response regulator [Pseudobacteriovorax sp.]|nr:response regulator [Pseudobacteriovorax sp.]